ncbi:thermonuclease family protein, partial [Mesorhizobium sp. M2D.F.Ca.ET.140.01.1.1]
MRLLQIILTVLAVPVMAALVVAGGRVVKGHESVITVDQIDPIADALPTDGNDTLSASGADTPPEEP